MKMRIWFAGLTLALCATTASAGENFAQKFLSRYKPPSVVDPAAQTASQVPEATIQQLIHEGSLPLTVADVIRFMLESNLDFKVNRYDPLTQQFLLDTLFRPFEPTLRLSAGVTHNTQATVSTLTAGQSLTHSYGATFTQNFATGLGISVSAVMNRTSDNNVFNTFNPAYSGRITYGISQNLLRDYGRDANLHTIRVGQNTKKMSDIQFELNLIDLVTAAQNMYWDLVGSREDVAVKQESVRLAEKTLSDNKRQVEIGTLARSDVVQTEANLANRQQLLVVSSYTADQLQDRLKRVITSSGDPAMILARLNPTEPVHPPQDSDLIPVEDAIRYALENRPEMRQMLLTLQNNDLDLKYQKNQLLPAFTVSASYTQSGVGGNSIEQGTGRLLSQGGLGDAFSQIFGYNFTGYSAGFSLSIPLSNKSAQAEYSRLTAEKQSTEAKRTALAQAIALDVRNAHSVVEMDRARIVAAQKSRELAELQLQAEQKKFQLGSGQIRFVLEEQQNLTNAQTIENQSLVNYAKALVDFDRAIGRTLKHNNIEIDKDLKAAVRSNGTANAN